MIKQSGQYLDYNDQTRNFEEFFNLTEYELSRLQAESEEGIQVDMENAIKSGSIKQLFDFLEMLVHRSYGRKTADGKKFEKSPEILQDFVNSAHYSDFMMGLLANDGEKALEFIKGIMPQKLIDRAIAQGQGQQVDLPDSKSYAPSAREAFDAAQRRAQEVLLQPSTPSEFTPQEAPAPQPVQTAQVDPEFEEFRQWKAQQAAAQQGSGFRVPAEDPQQSATGRPPHEQVGPTE